MGKAMKSIQLVLIAVFASTLHSSFAHAIGVSPYFNVVDFGATGNGKVLCTKAKYVTYLV